MRLLSSLLLALCLAGPAAAQQRYRLDLPAPLIAADLAAGGSVQFIGTATVLIRFRGFTILTDPNFLHKGDRVRLGYGLTSERLTNPALDLDSLPPIDFVLLSHLHEDHFDRLVQERLDRGTVIVTTRQAAEQLGKLGFTRRYGLAPWDTVEVTKGPARLRITALPGMHGKGGVQALLPPVMGSMLEFPSYRIYITGDTLLDEDLAAIPKRFPDIDMALLHLGGARLLGLFKVSMDGADGVSLMQLVKPRVAIPIHVDDYDVFRSPLEDFQRRVKDAGLETLVIYLRHGEAYTFMPRPAPP
ncbi:MAG: MBL fold metallo-hydrolase [Telluria sp.]